MSCKQPLIKTSQINLSLSEDYKAPSGWQTSHNNKPPSSLDCLLGEEKANDSTDAGEPKTPEKDASAKEATAAKRPAAGCEAQGLATAHRTCSFSGPTCQTGCAGAM